MRTGIKTQPPRRAELEEILARYPDLAPYLDDACQEMLARAEVVNFPRDTLLFSENNTCCNFMLLLEGSVRVFKQSEEGREMTIYRVEAGELCMLSLNSLMSQQPYPASAIAEERIRALSLSAASFKKYIGLSEGFRDYVLRSLTQRLADVICLASETVFKRLDLRLACHLGQLFERSGGEPLTITHAELARELGTTREVISRILKEFENQNCIRLGRGMIHMTSPEGIQWLNQA